MLEKLFLENILPLSYYKAWLNVGVKTSAIFYTVEAILTLLYKMLTIWQS